MNDKNLDQTTIQQLQQHEKKALEQKVKGNVLGALEELDKAITIQKRWYHLFVKATWLYEPKIELLKSVADIIDEGIKRFPEEAFFFYFLRADLKHQTSLLIINENKSVDNALRILRDAQKDIEYASNLLFSNPNRVKIIVETETPFLLPDVWQNIEINDVRQKSAIIRDQIIASYRTISLIDYTFKAENRLKSEINTQKEEMHSEKMRTIEILGFFTAIMAFIILSGNVALNTTYDQAMPLLGGLSLVIALLVAIASIMTSRFNRYRDIPKDPRFWIISVLSIVIATLVYFSIKEAKTTINTPKVPTASQTTPVSP